MEESISSLKRTARLTGFVYFVFALTAIYAYLYVSSKVKIIPGDAEATAANILANEFLYRTGILGIIISNTLFILTVMLLYRLFKSVDEFQAKLMVAFVVVHVAISFVLLASRITALRILKGGIVSGVEPEQLHDLAMIFFRFRESDILIGIWLMPLAYLVYKSGFIPRFFTILLFLCGIGYVADSITFVLFPENTNTVSQITIWLEAVGEPLFILWLMIFGVRIKKT